MAKKEKKDNFKVIIAGSRGFSNYKLLKETCDKLLKEKKKTHNVVVISGNAKGADSLGEKYSNDEDLDLEIFPADWKKFGKSAGFRRNEQMAEFADALIAFWDGKSNGTKHMIDTATNKGMQIKVVNYGKNQASN
jgi:hypothetical protein